MGLFMRSKLALTAPSRSIAEIKSFGTPTWATVTNVIAKRNGYIVTAVQEDNWLGTRRTFTSETKPVIPRVGIGGLVRVLVDEINASGAYYMEC